MDQANINRFEVLRNGGSKEADSGLGRKFYWAEKGKWIEELVLLCRSSNSVPLQKGLKKGNGLDRRRKWVESLGGERGGSKH